MSQAARVVLGPPVAASTPGNAGAASQRPEIAGHPVQQAASAAPLPPPADLSRRVGANPPRA
eukprot:1282277-Amphidinium_carterae.1